MKTLLTAALIAALWCGVAQAATIRGGTTVIPPPPSPTNTMTISSAAGVATTNYPFQFGRPFLAGEIPHAPQVLINGTPVTTQADVKNRYPDGSVEFAVLAVQLPSMSANACDLINTDPTAMPPYGLWAQHANSPVFNTPFSAPGHAALVNTLTASFCDHDVGGVNPRSMITVENTAAQSRIGGQMGFVEYPPTYSTAGGGQMFSSMVCNNTSWCPSLGVGVDMEGGGIWNNTTYSVIGITSPGSGNTPTIVYYNGSQVASGTPNINGTSTATLATEGDLVWGLDGDHFYAGPVIGFDQIFVASALSPTQQALIGTTLQAFYVPPGEPTPLVCSTLGITCDIALSVTQRLVTGATKAFQLYNVSAATTHDVSFTSNGNVDTADALSFCGTVANCRYRIIYDQMGEVASHPQSITITFQDTSATPPGPLTLAQMEALLPVGAAKMTLAATAGGGSADAGQMLADGNCTLRTSGQVAQTVECADDSNTRRYDIGFGDAYRPFRPRFYATFWPGTNQVYIRAVGENGISTEREDALTI